MIACYNLRMKKVALSTLQQSLACINYLDCITLSGCECHIFTIGYLKWLFCMGAGFLHPCRWKSILMSGMQMHFCSFVSLCKQMPFDPWRRSSAMCCVGSCFSCPFIMHLMPNISISLLSIQDDAHTLSVDALNSVSSPKATAPWIHCSGWRVSQ